MQASQAPAKIPLPFANNAGPSYIRPIPTNSQLPGNPGAASFYDGFPPGTFVDPLAGGIPPDGRDFNGLLNQMSAGLQWLQAGGAFPYDAAFQTAIGGYPAGAVVASAASPGSYWYSINDNNLTNPDTGGAGWVRWPLRYAASDTGTANAIQIALTPAPTSLAALAWVPIFISKGAAPNSGPITIQVNSLPATAAVRPDGSAFAANQWLGYEVGIAVYNGSAFVVFGILPPGRLLNVQFFSTPGTTTYNPTPGTNSIIVQLQGGGGAGGGVVATGSNQFAVGAGGGAGGIAVSRYTSGFAGQTVTIGAGGVPVVGNTGGDGGSTSFGSLMSATGGSGGSIGLAIPSGQAAVEAGGQGGVGAVGNIYAAVGQDGINSVGTATSNYISGSGGPSLLGGGGRRLVTGASDNGSAALVGGSGGGGAAASNGGGPFAGGAGAPGYVLIWEFS